MKSGTFLMGLIVATMLLSFATIQIVRGEEQTSISVQEIVKKTLARAQQSEKDAGQPGYSYTKVTITEECDKTGKVKEHKEKVYQAVFQGGITRLKVVNIDGRAPTEEELKRIAENDANIRKLLDDPKAKKAGRENMFTDDLVSRFDFVLLGTESIDSRDTYKISFQPKNPAVAEHRMVDKFLNRMSGTLWIDAREFEVARVDANLKSEVNILGGTIASLKRLDFTLTRTRVAEGIWLNTSSSGDFQGRKLIDRMWIKTRSQTSNFRPLS